MAALKNTKEEATVQNHIQGMSQTDAHDAAGYRRSDPNASRMFALPRVKARIAELQERAADKAVITKSDIIKDLKRNADDAHIAKQYGASNRALELIGKDMSMFKERFELMGENGGPIEVADVSESVEREIDKLFAEPAGIAGGGEKVVH